MIDIEKLRKIAAEEALEDGHGIGWYILELRNRLNHFYLQTDGTYKFPNSAEGDLLKMFEKFLTLAVEKFNN